VLLEGTDFRWTGKVDAEEILSVAADRDPSLLGPNTIRAMLGEGDARRLAQMMSGANVLFPAFYKLLAHPMWSVRLGAMAAFEHLVEEDPKLAAAAAEKLWELYETATDDGVAGDALYLLGQTGRKDFAQRVRRAAESAQSPDVREAAADAADQLEAAG
ncbi:MAG: hypothetical protein JRI97_06700, partial [Deltaproteobacteria bacterium]|nr:hypothetical protein [Deltaproteobacteria bacterium]